MGCVVCLFDSWMIFLEGLTLHVVTALDFLLLLDLGPLFALEVMVRVMQEQLRSK